MMEIFVSIFTNQIDEVVDSDWNRDFLCTELSQIVDDEVVGRAIGDQNRLISRGEGGDSVEKVLGCVGRGLLKLTQTDFEERNDSSGIDLRIGRERLQGLSLNVRVDLGRRSEAAAL